MRIDGIGFSGEFAKSVKESAFVKHFLDIHFQELPEDERKKKLKEIYSLLINDNQRETNTVAGEDARTPECAD